MSGFEIFISYYTCQLTEMQMHDMIDFEEKN